VLMSHNTHRFCVVWSLMNGVLLLFGALRIRMEVNVKGKERERLQTEEQGNGVLYKEAKNKKNRRIAAVIIYCQARRPRGRRH